MAAQISAFIEELHAAPVEMSLMVHCEYGVSRSAAVALFAEALTGAPLEAREFTYEANQWVLDQLQQRHPGLEVDMPAPLISRERRAARR
jgi:protein-tyrosine phosphatase